MNHAETLALCAFCDGDGKCSACGGTGQNPDGKAPDPYCQRCAGSGTCAQCLGSGSTHTPQGNNLHQEIVQL